MPARVEHRGLQRYLLPGEHPVTEIRHHAIVLTKPALALALATLVAGWLDLSVSIAQNDILGWVWLVWLAVFGWAAWQWVEWRNTRVVATDRRIVRFEGWLNHKVSMMPLKKVTDMGYERSVLGRLLGYGTFVLESAGQDQALSRITFVPHPDENYRAICAVVFGVGDEDDEESPAWETAQDYATRLGVVDGVYVGTGPEVTFDDRYPMEPAYPGAGSIYRSSDLVRRDQDADTGELPPYDPYAS